MTTDIDPGFEPMDVRFTEPFPFGDTFGRVEVEAAMAYFIRTLVIQCDSWVDLGVNQIKEAARKDAKGTGIMAVLADNPAYKPDWQGLVENGFAEFVPGRDGSDRLKLTGKAFKYLLQWTGPGRCHCGEHVRTWVKDAAHKRVTVCRTHALILIRESVTRLQTGEWVPSGRA